MPSNPRPRHRPVPLARPTTGTRLTPSAAKTAAHRSVERRSRRYLDLITGLDASTATVRVDTSEVRERISAELAASAVPIGIIAHCHLGEDFQVHTITPALDDIIAHYRRGEPLPDGLERARAWTRTASYLAVEVYEDGVLCIRPDGTVIKAEG